MDLISKQNRKALAEAHLRQASDQLDKAGDKEAAQRVKTVLRTVAAPRVRAPRHA